LCPTRIREKKMRQFVLVLAAMVCFGINVDAMFCTSGSESVQTERNSKPPKFKLKIVFIGNDIIVKNIKGGGFDQFGFLLEEGDTAVINQSGMKFYNGTIINYDSRASFIITITKTKGEIVFEGSKGTSWKQFSFSYSNDCRLIIDQKRVKPDCLSAPKVRRSRKQDVSRTNLYGLSDSALIMQHLTTITKTDGYRNSRNIPLLNQTAEYIFSVFSQYADTTYYQTFQENGETYMNVVCRFGSANDKPLVVIGAHYDVEGYQEGADDNASGVVGVLELVRILSNSKEKINYPIEIVAYTLEERPFGLTGSNIHAKSLHDTGTPVYGMAAFEMIGYFDDRAKTQSYPVKVMRVFYGNRGNFIVLARKAKAETFVKNFSDGFKKNAMIDTKTFKASSKNIKTISTSDHASYWRYGYDALMITNTAHYRNRNYHRRSDTMETLDILKMMKVIDATAGAIINLK